ncbi:MAG: hypothetical protein HYU86_00275 [Chloroflexi bacterium]|nr:hypothetical protein [Chloroflexota bacterium]
MSTVSDAPPILFLETTIQIDRVIGTQDRRATITSHIGGRRLCTSGHVLGEYNRTLIRDAITFRDLLRSSPSVEEAIKRLGRYAPYGRKYRRTVDLLASIGFDSDRQNTLDRLEIYIDWYLHKRFWESIDPSISTDNVRCFLRLWQPKLPDGETYDLVGLKCIKDNPPPCEVSAFIEQHRSELQYFAQEARSHPRPNVASAAEAFRRIIAGEEVPFGERSNCYAIADTLIVLEAPPDALVYSADGDVHVICDIFSRARYTEVGTNV